MTREHPTLLSMLRRHGITRDASDIDGAVWDLLWLLHVQKQCANAWATACERMSLDALDDLLKGAAMTDPKTDPETSWLFQGPSCTYASPGCGACDTCKLFIARKLAAIARAALAPAVHDDVTHEDLLDASERALDALNDLLKVTR